MAQQLQTITDEKVKIKEPGKVKVVMYNDDFTPMEFVVDLLMGVFHKPQQEAMAIMMQIHRGTKETVGEYPYDIARTRVDICTRRAREEGYPLVTKVEE